MVEKIETFVRCLHILPYLPYRLSEKCPSLLSSLNSGYKHIDRLNLPKNYPLVLKALAHFHDGLEGIFVLALIFLDKILSALNMDCLESSLAITFLSIGDFFPFRILFVQRFLDLNSLSSLSLPPLTLDILE